MGPTGVIAVGGSGGGGSYNGGGGGAGLYYVNNSVAITAGRMGVAVVKVVEACSFWEGNQGGSTTPQDSGTEEVHIHCWSPNIHNWCSKYRSYSRD